MRLIDYLNAIPVEAREDFAKRCETSFDYLRQVGYGNRVCKESLAINLERESGRVLVCEELCPGTDWAFVRESQVPAKRSHNNLESHLGRAGRRPIDARKIMTAAVDQPLTHTTNKD